VFPFAGFWSKDEILLAAWNSNPALWVVGLVTALLTAFYMSRQVFMVFFGEPRWEHAHHEGGEAEQSAAEVAQDERSESDHQDGDRAKVGVGDHAQGAPTPHESPWTMWVPLVVLAVLAVLGGGLNLPVHHDLHFLATWLHPVVHATEVEPDVATGTKIGLAVVATIAGLVGIGLAVAVYLQKRVRAVEPDLLLHAYHYDDALAAFFGGPATVGAELTAMADKAGIDGAVNGVGQLVREGGSRLRVVQTGFVRNYALAIAGGAVLLLGWLTIKAGI
jgi:NADH-quinone oxidoreductase subunit L